MTTNELQQKFYDSVEKVQKRTKTIEKLCKKLEINSEDLIKKYHEVINDDFEPYYLSNAKREEIISSFVTEKNIYDGQGHCIEENYDYNQKISDLFDNLYKLYEVERVAHNWEVKLQKELNKENIEKIPAIWNFLCDWETKTIDWYKENCKKYFELKKNEKDAVKKYQNSKEFNDKLERNLSYYKEEKRTNYLKDRIAYSLTDNFKLNYYSGIDAFTKRITDIKGTYIYENEDEYIGTYVYVSYTIDEELLIKEVAKEKLSKYIDLVNRITKEVGEIKDAKNLSIGNQKGELNGFVIGVKGTCKVETISAGGYNVQRFHYRCLVHKIK